MHNEQIHNDVRYIVEAAADKTTSFQSLHTQYLLKR